MGIPTLLGSVHLNFVSKFKNDKPQHAIWSFIVFYSAIDIQETFYKYFSADVSSLNRICKDFCTKQVLHPIPLLSFCSLSKHCIWLVLQVQPHVFFLLLERWNNFQHLLEENVTIGLKTQPAHGQPILLIHHCFSCASPRLFGWAISVSPLYGLQTFLCTWWPRTRFWNFV